MSSTGSPAIDRLIEAVNDHDPDAMVSCFHEDYRSEQPLHPAARFTGREQVRTNWSGMFGAIPDLRFDVLRSATRGDEIWLEVRVHGRKADDAPFDYRGVIINGVRDDRIAWARLYFEVVEEGGGDIGARQRQVLGEDD